VPARREFPAQVRAEESRGSGDGDVHQPLPASMTDLTSVA